MVPGWGLCAPRAGLPPLEEVVLATHGPFLQELETTPLEKGDKMVLLHAMLNLDSLPGSVALAELTGEFAQLAGRSAQLAKDVSLNLSDQRPLQALVRSSPILAWSDRTSGRDPFFTFQEGIFATAFQASPEMREPLQQLVRELVDWRLGEYLDRPGRQAGDRFECRVGLASGRPVLSLPKPMTPPRVSEGWTLVKVADDLLEGNLASTPIDVIREPGRDTNRLPGILRGWFGPDAGQPGTRHQVVFQLQDDLWHLSPVGLSGRGTAVLWKRYSREQIPELFGQTFNTGSWNQGYVRSGKHIFLLVTLAKGDLSKEHQYEDRFLGPERFQWQSQNRTTQASKDGQSMRSHQEQGLSVHLFVRAKKRDPFIYCGDVEFADWTGEKPITIQWRLPEPVPERLRGELLRN